MRGKVRKKKKHTGEGRGGEGEGAIVEERLLALFVRKCE